MSSTLHRRRFLQVSAVGGGMLLGVSFLGCKSSKPRGGEAPPESPADNPPEPAATGEPVNLDAWVRIDPDGTITIRVAESEMGQGVLTALPMIVAEELRADWSKVRSEHAPADPSKYGNQSTGGSTSVRKGHDMLRQAGAAARHMLVAAAARRFGVDPGECRAEGSQVIHDSSGRRAGYGELAAEAATMPVPDEPALAARDEASLVGEPVKRLDTPSKVDGSAVYGLDVRRPGLLVAQVAHSPYVAGGTVASFDASAAEKVPGVKHVVQIPTGVAVVAEHFWAAEKGREALVVEWDPGAHGTLSSESIARTLREVVARGKTARQDGEPKKAMAGARRTLEAVYEAPYLAHAPMEPLNCTVEITGDRAEVWVSTQSPTRVLNTTAEITGLDPEAISVHTTLLGGGFGRRSQGDFVAEAVHVAKAVGKPVKTVWTRADDIRGGFYRPVAYNELAGAVDADGWPVAWTHRIASPSILEAFGPLQDGIDRTSIEGAANLPYGIPNLHVTYANADLPISTWFWRSVGSSQNAYVTECFLDELAKLGGKDPFELRRRLLADKPRHLRVLETAADKAGWGSALPEGRARGIAVHESFGSFVAQVAEISIEGGQVRVHRVVCAVDCGSVINPDTVAAQMDSGVAYGLSAALYGTIDIKDGKVVQSNFHDYPVVRMLEMPVVETHIVTRGDPLGGIGEPGTPPIAPAVCNAILTLTGKPVRKLPIGKLA